MSRSDEPQSIALLRKTLRYPALAATKHDVGGAYVPTVFVGMYATQQAAHTLPPMTSCLAAFIERVHGSEQMTPLMRARDWRLALE
jgi:hypothetical protein